MLKNKPFLKGTGKYHLNIHKKSLKMSYKFSTRTIRTTQSFPKFHKISFKKSSKPSSSLSAKTSVASLTLFSTWTWSTPKVAPKSSPPYLLCYVSLPKANNSTPWFKVKIMGKNKSKLRKNPLILSPNFRCEPTFMKSPKTTQIRYTPI